MSKALTEKDIQSEIGKTYNSWTIISFDKLGNNGHRYYICRCVCGKERSVNIYNIKNNKSKSCGCQKKTTLKNLVGERFGRLTVIERVQNHIKPNGQPTTMWKCKCDCGNTTIVSTGNLKSGNTKSCGCLSIDLITDLGHKSAKHGLTHTHIYRVWKLMRERCYNKKKDNYKRYGGRGISVCDEWIGENGFINFYNWAINNGYDESLQIDRINNDGNYCPENCRWVTNKINMRNRRVNHFIDTPFGNITIAEFAERINGDYDLIYSQISSGRHDIKWITEHYKNTNDYKGENANGL